MIRKAELMDFDEIIEVYKHARAFMTDCGNPTQWNNFEQLKNNVLKDIENGNCYVCLDDEKIAAVFCFFIGKDSTYDVIYDGKWLNEKSYGVIHRIVVIIHRKGIATKCIKWCLEKYPNIRIDTHKDNIPMQKTILKSGFKYCGIIHKEDGTSRLAYQSLV